MRLWGKILGINSNYIVVEGDFKEGAVDEEDELVNGVPQDDEVAEAVPAAPSNDEIDPNDEALPAPVPMPKAKAKIVPPLPREARSGANKYVYYVCSHGT